MRVLVFDTETTGIDTSTAHVVELAALLFDDAGIERASLDLIIKPDGYEIPAAASAIHGISTDLAHRVGVPLAYAASAFNALCEQADRLVAHNLAYDVAIMEGLYRRLGKPHRMPVASNRYCTAMWSTPVCAIPPTECMRAAGRHEFKKPTLTEAYAFVCGKELVGAHNALVDARACGEVYFELQRQRAGREAEAEAAKATRRQSTQSGRKGFQHKQHPETYGYSDFSVERNAK